MKLKNKYKYKTGFNLIELIITMAIISILTSIAYPSYIHHVHKSRRHDAHTALLHLSALLEKYYLENNTYQGATLGKLGLPSTSTEKYYQIDILSLTKNTYHLIAKPIQNTSQETDPCGALTLTHTYLKGPHATCWQ